MHDPLTKPNYIPVLLSGKSSHVPLVWAPNGEYKQTLVINCIYLIRLLGPCRWKTSCFWADISGKNTNYSAMTITSTKWPSSTAVLCAVVRIATGILGLLVNETKVVWDQSCLQCQQGQLTGLMVTKSHHWSVCMFAGESNYPTTDIDHDVHIISLCSSSNIYPYDW